MGKRLRREYAADHVKEYVNVAEATVTQTVTTTVSRRESVTSVSASKARVEKLMEKRKKRQKLDVKVSHGTYSYKDEHLAELGAQIKTLEERRTQLNRELNELSLQLQGTIGALDSLQEKYDAQLRRVTKAPLHTQNLSRIPNEIQQKTLNTFSLMLSQENVAMLEMAYELAKEVRAHETCWKDSKGNNVVQAYTSRIAELEKKA